MWANSVWSLFTLGVGFWLAVIGLSQDFIWLRPWFLGTGFACCAGSLMVLLSPLSREEKRTIVVANIQHPAKWLKELLEPSHIIIVGLAIAAIGVVWEMRREPRSDQQNVGLRTELENLRQQLAAANSAPSVAPSVSRPEPVKALSPKAVRELLGALNDARVLHSKIISPTMAQIDSWAVNWRGVMRNSNGVQLYSRLRDELKAEVWDKIDGLIEKNKSYQNELEAAFALDHPVAKDELSRALQSVIEAIQRLPANSPPEMDDLLEPQFKELIKQSNLGWQWVTQADQRLNKMTESVSSRGIAEYQ